MDVKLRKLRIGYKSSCFFGEPHLKWTSWGGFNGQKLYVLEEYVALIRTALYTSLHRVSVFLTIYKRRVDAKTLAPSMFGFIFDRGL